jgi:hypothetical protein
MTVERLILEEKAVEIDEGLNHLRKRIDAGEINDLAMAIEGDENLLTLLAFIADGASLAAKVGIDPLKYPLQKGLWLKLSGIPKRAFDDTRHLGENFGATDAKLRWMARGRQPTA